ncbi:hypothetical protein [Thiolapillus sp.]|uniref:hypothetical protein n=1 Tax=Thiolapillus sp. TaxID=2017437 RepID=UPI0025F1D736|nr:hypothetical protein [Thiolapillus sp.]
MLKEIEKVLRDELRLVIDADVSEWDNLALKGNSVNIAGKEYFLDRWVEHAPGMNGMLFVIELTKNKLIGQEVHSVGVLYKDGKKKILNEEDMWNIGLG